MTKVPFPMPQVGAASIHRVTNPCGLFGYQVQAAISLLARREHDELSEAPTHEERMQHHDGFLGLKRPLTSLALFFVVAALEDLVREFGNALAACTLVRSAFPTIDDVKTRPAKPKNPGDRLDADAASYLKPRSVNADTVRCSGSLWWPLTKRTACRILP